MTLYQQRLLRMLRLAGGYGRKVWGQELRAARALERLGLATVEQSESHWFAYIKAAAASAAKEER